MTNTRKLLDDSPDELTANLLGSALDDEPSPRALARTAAALGVAGAASLAAGTAVAGASGTAGASAAGKTLGFLGFKWFGLGAIAGLVLAGGADLALRGNGSTSLRPPVDLPAARVEAQPRGVLPVPADPGRQEVAKDTEVRQPSAAPKANPGSGRQPAAGNDETQTPPSAKTPTIAGEIAALDRARAALRKNDPAGALAVVDGLERGGATALGPEAKVVRVEALLARGEKSKATALAKKFISENPTSPHANRMREIVNDQK